MIDEQSASHWEKGDRQQALIRMWTLATRPDASPTIILQAMYYMYCAGTFRPAQEIARAACKRFPDDLTLLLNSGVIEQRLGEFAAARALFERYLHLGGAEASVLDGLATTCFELGELDAARHWGALAIETKTAQGARQFAPLSLAAPRTSGANVISFSLWGDDPRYLRGGLHNLLRARTIYPDFKCRFIVDPSVPADLLHALQGEGAAVYRDDAEPTLLRRLGRRFLVADDPDVRLYLVRDADSVIGHREAAAVAEWLAGGRPFHVMRDWWTHTDPMLAGMWGGTGGVLPPVEPYLMAYQPEHMETGHIDQWFLRDCIWPSIRSVCTTHDRCFQTHGSIPFPSPTPKGDDHVGQNEYSAALEQQARELAPFARTVASLAL